MTNDSTSPLAQMMSLVLLGDFLSVYLALLNGVDPSLAGAVDEFKATLNEKTKHGISTQG